MTFGWKLDDLHTTPIMFSNFAVHAWRQCGRFKQITSYIGSLGGQTHFGMPRGATKMSLALIEPK